MGGIACEICESEVFLTSVGLRVGGTVAGRLLCILQARQNSPSARKTPQIRRFCVSRANFVSHKARYASCWAKKVSATGAAARLADRAVTAALAAFGC